MSDRTFMNIPISGEPQGREDRTPQKPLSELEPLLRAVLDDPNVRSFAWTQYTPYFNDGEPCYFRTSELSFRAAVPGEEPSEEFDEDHPDYDYSVGSSRYQRQHPDLKDADTLNRCRALAEAVDSGAFENALLGAFGDHAEVIVKPAGITISEYSHE